MKTKTILITLLSTLALSYAIADAPAERIARVRKLVAKQRSGLVWTWNELQTAKTQIAQVAKERDGWRAYGNDQYEQHMNAEVRVAKEQKRVLQLYLIIGGLGLAIAGYAFAKFYLHLPI